MPLSLSVEEMDSVLTAARPIALGERDHFLRELAAELAQYAPSEIGPGLIHRLAADLQRRFTVVARREAETGSGTPRHSRTTQREAQPAR